MSDHDARIVIDPKPLPRSIPRYTEQHARADEIAARLSVPNNSYEQSIVDRHSTPGLRRGQLSRSAKRDHLAGMKVPADDTVKILKELYGNDGPAEG